MSKVTWRQRGARQPPPRPGFERQVVSSFRGTVKIPPRMPGEVRERKPWPWPAGHPRATLQPEASSAAKAPPEAPVSLVRWPGGRRTS